MILLASSSEQIGEAALDEKTEHLSELMLLRSSSTVATWSSFNISNVTVRCSRSSEEISNMIALSRSKKIKFLILCQRL